MGGVLGGGPVALGLPQDLVAPDVQDVGDVLLSAVVAALQRVDRLPELGLDALVLFVAALAGLGDQVPQFGAGLVVRAGGHG
ncbi:hypothetical protein [Streptomyces sp. NPDC088115]|uniref:hypothetical protein n=1 Tax=Streptomyces sp. NPDC088115 TaxID=3365824 RepID=UPI00382AF8F1